MTAFAERHGTALLLVLSTCILAAVPLVSGGLFNIDEVIYLLGAKTLAASGHLGIANGYPSYGSEALKLWLLSAGADGLVPQYPVGTALAGAPLYAAFGSHGLIVLNAAAMAGTLFVTRGLARTLYGDEGSALLAPLLLVFGSFALEYAFGIWPHGVSTFCVAAALLLALRSLDAEGRAGIARAMGSGLLVGLGFLFRLDTVLVLPLIAACVVLLARRPVATLAAGVAGMLPGLAVAAWANMVKFGTPNPLSYGQPQGGGTSSSSYVGLGVALAMAGLLLVALRLFRRSLLRRRVALAVLAAVALVLVLALLLAPGVRQALERLAQGFYVLVLDIRPIHDSRPGVVHAADGTVGFWGLYKKALGQSLPWLGLLPALFARRWGLDAWRGHAILLGGALLWMLPFLPTEWHGGLGSNMRYFLPILPLLAVLVARIWTGVLEPGGLAARERWLWPLIGAALVVAWSRVLPSGLGGAEQILPGYALAGMAFLAALTCLPRSLGLATLALGLARRGALVTVGMALALGPLLDLGAAQSRRIAIAREATQMLNLPAPALVIAPPEIMAPLIGRPGYLAAVPDRLSDEVDAGLVNRALDDGYKVFVANWLVPGLLASDRSVRVAAAGAGAGGTSRPVTEIVRAGGD
ncbi:hypothetical protein [Acidimangrovimonas pyrenivorans]|uniref:Glycosyltransferase RgtA/B/C/D-like domain-containing protein n=1 Tax=Acidimangrovimonas pyrenivorans TaxID=2030798 RepID=A0ABV7ACE6_9RHOB